MTTALWRALRRLRPTGFHYERVLGTSLDGVVLAHATAAVEVAVLAEIQRLEPLLSSFDPESEFCRWQAARGELLPLSPELLAVLESATRWQWRTHSAFHPGAEALTALWKAAEARDELPDPGALAATVAALREPLWECQLRAGKACCWSKLPLTLNAIAKGTIVDRACAAGSTHAADLLLSIGGDLCHRGELTHWVGVTDPDALAENAPPLTRVRLHNQALATSGPGRRGFSIAGQEYSHVLDPRTGWPATAVRQASVLAPTTETADVLATAFTVLSPAESLALAESLPELGCLLVATDGTLYKSSRWEAAEQQERKP